MARRKALIVGINHYERFSALTGCVNDATAVHDVLKKNGDGKPNFPAPTLLIGTDATRRVDEITLKRELEELFLDNPNVALFYFAGHGIQGSADVTLAASDSHNTGGISVDWLIKLANKSNAANSVIILDCCHAGAVGQSNLDADFSEIKRGTTILTATTAESVAKESNGRGVFTDLLVKALEGAAADLLGYITPGSVYAHIDQSLGQKSQRPVFKTNITEFVSLREVVTQLSRDNLQQISHLFPKEGFVFQLDPSFEPVRAGNEPPSFPEPNPDNVAKFKILQSYNRVNMLVPVGAPNMWDAAMNSKTCQLTALGEHYRRLDVKGLI